MFHRRPDLPAIKKKLDAFTKKGGRLILSHESGMDEERGDFALPRMSIKYMGKGDYRPDYFQVRKKIASGIPDMPHIMYEGHSKVKALKGTEVLATVKQPYFNRTYRHFSSHFQTRVWW